MTKADRYTIQYYTGYTDLKKSVIGGRVLDDEVISSSPSDNWYQNFIHTYRSFNSNEVCDQQVVLELHNETYHTLTDDEGYFSFDIVQDIDETDSKTIACHLSLPGQQSIVATMIKVCGSYIIVSDLDDTIIHTYVKSRWKLKMLFLTIFRNYHQRAVVKGMPSVYSDIEDKYGASFFYISKSPYNLYPYIRSFLSLHRFPVGAIMLRDFGLHILKAPNLYGKKYYDVLNLLERYPDKNFVLVGDSAEHDADIYAKLANKYSNQVKAICIRNTGQSKNLHRISTELMQCTQTPMYLFDDHRMLLLCLRKVFRDL